MSEKRGANYTARSDKVVRMHTVEDVSGFLALMGSVSGRDIIPHVAARSLGAEVETVSVLAHAAGHMSSASWMPTVLRVHPTLCRPTMVLFGRMTTLVLSPVLTSGVVWSVAMSFAGKYSSTAIFREAVDNISSLMFSPTGGTPVYMKGELSLALPPSCMSPLILAPCLARYHAWGGDALVGMGPPPTAETLVKGCVLMLLFMYGAWRLAHISNLSLDVDAQVRRMMSRAYMPGLLTGGLTAVPFNNMVAAMMESSGVLFGRVLLKASLMSTRYEDVISVFGDGRIAPQAEELVMITGTIPTASALHGMMNPLVTKTVCTKAQWYMHGQLPGGSSVMGAIVGLDRLQTIEYGLVSGTPGCLSTRLVQMKIKHSYRNEISDWNVDKPVLVSGVTYAPAFRITTLRDCAIASTPHTIAPEKWFITDYVTRVSVGVGGSAQPPYIDPDDDPGGGDDSGGDDDTRLIDDMEISDDDVQEDGEDDSDEVDVDSGGSEYRKKGLVERGIVPDPVDRRDIGADGIDMKLGRLPATLVASGAGTEKTVAFPGLRGRARAVEKEKMREGAREGARVLTKGTRVTVAPVGTFRLDGRSPVEKVAVAVSTGAMKMDDLRTLRQCGGAQFVGCMSKGPRGMHGKVLDACQMGLATVLVGDGGDPEQVSKRIAAGSVLADHLKALDIWDVMLETPKAERLEAARLLTALSEVASGAIVSPTDRAHCIKVGASSRQFAQAFAYGGAMTVEELAQDTRKMATEYDGLGDADIECLVRSGFNVVREVNAALLTAKDKSKRQGGVPASVLTDVISGVKRAANTAHEEAYREQLVGMRGMVEAGIMELGELIESGAVTRDELITHKVYTSAEIDSIMGSSSGSNNPDVGVEPLLRMDDLHTGADDLVCDDDPGGALGGAGAPVDGGDGHGQDSGDAGEPDFIAASLHTTDTLPVVSVPGESSGAMGDAEIVHDALAVMDFVHGGV